MANKLVIILFLYLTLPNWIPTSTALQASSTYSGQRKASQKNYSLFSLTKVPTNAQQMRLFCRVGLFLSMNRNGTVSGVLQKNGTQEIFELQSFGTSIVRIKHKVTGLFVAMNNKGKVKGQRNAVSSKDLYFYLNHEENAFVSFASFYHKKKKKSLEMFLGIKRGGEVKNGKQTSTGQDSIEFLSLDIS
ncbi:fibroblast growth factor 22-like isoform X2 [Actinia tenebrosa]|uniref:Fibroblast growth factor 22-like isoform X2 n=1 Tax=Actinia tenebrosa TaxID=6105 RepID=A0A6P8IKL3_ACTTE|nr:fibroblast growth factor 22-like isoform X2 [Actinia tenebrosa]